MLDAQLLNLLTPLEGDAPCGADLEYDPVFLSLQEAAAGKGEQQFGATVIAAQGPDWPVVHDLAQQLAGRTRDLRVAIWLTRSAAHVQGLSGAVRGLQLVQGLAEQHWAHVHPQLDASDHNDPTARMSALSPLAHATAGLADLRSASLTGQRGSLTLRDIELAMGPSDPRPGEAVPTEDGVVQGVGAALAANPALGDVMAAGADAVKGLQAVLEKHVAASQAPELGPLLKLMQRTATAAAKARGVAAPEGTPGEAGVVAAPPPALGVIGSREDAIRLLERVAEWIERNEPSNPAPLLIRRSQRLMTKNFLDIIRDLVPDGVSQIEKLAGANKP